MATRKSKATTPEVVEQVAASTKTPAELAGIKAYNAAYLAEVKAAAALGPIDGQRLVQAHYRARTQLRSLISVADAVCPMCSGTQVAI